MYPTSILEYIDNNRQDAIKWQANAWMEEAGTTPSQKASVAFKIAEALLAKVENGIARELYIKEFAKDFGIDKKEFTTMVADERDKYFFDNEKKEEKDNFKMPSWVKDPAEVYRDGFVQRYDVFGKHGCYFMGESTTLIQQTNFTIKPLYHLYSQRAENNRRMIEVSNGLTASIVEMPSKGVLSVDQFCSALYNEGTYLPMGGFGKPHLLKILNKLSPDFTMCYEMEQLGWQPGEGFFAYSNTAFLPGKKDGAPGERADYNDYGVVKVEDKHFLSPANSKANEHVRSSDNIYENDLYLTYKESPINFEQWCELMVKVYGENAWMAIPFAIATIFRDIVIKITKIPHLYAYGPVGSGKSEYGESVTYLFFSGKNSQGELYKPFNLNQGTEFAFWNGMERFQNCPFMLNEFDENAIDESRFRAIKSAYDSEGRAKGMKEKNRATMQKVVCTLILAGQYLGSKDDNAVLMRSLPLPFKPNNNRTQEQIEDFTRLKEYERKGLSGILLELMDMRARVERDLPQAFSDVSKVMTEQLREQGVQPPTRVLKNVSLMVAMVEIAAKKFKLPFATDTFFSYAKDYIAHWTNTLSSSSGIAEFWSMMEFLLDTGKIEEGRDFEIRTEDRITITKNDSSETKTFTPAKTVIYVRINNIHKMYMEQYRKGMPGKSPLNEQTLKMYMMDQPYYIGWIKSRRFKKISPNAAYAFDYEALGINLIREEATANREPIEIPFAEVVTTPTQVSEHLYKFIIRTYEQVEKDGAPTETNTVSYVCLTSDSNCLGNVVDKYKIKLKGTLEYKIEGGKERRTIQVDDYESIPSYREFGATSKTVQQADLPL